MLVRGGINCKPRFSRPAFFFFFFFLVVHVLEKLGYWNGELIPEIPNVQLLEEMNGNKKELVAKINESLEATQIV